MSRRSGIFHALEKALEKGFYDSIEDAYERARDLAESRTVSQGRLASNEDEPAQDLKGSL